jgi:zinc transport system substrate-binding protein
MILIMLRALALLLLLPLLAGCGGLPAAHAGHGPVVVASFYPLEFVTQRLLGRQVGDLTSPGVEPHDVELSVRQVAEVSDADLVVYERTLQPAVDQAVDNNARDRALDVVPAASLERRDGAPDPHFWLDPTRLSKVAAVVAKRLERLDPAHAADYGSRLVTLQRQLAVVDAEYAGLRRGCRRSTIVVNHEAFGYLARYGIRVEALSGLTPDAEPSPAHLEKLQRLIRRLGITTVFSEPVASTKPMQALAHDLGVRAEVLDPMESQIDPDEDYLDVMNDNLTALRRADGCEEQR